MFVKEVVFLPNPNPSYILPLTKSNSSLRPLSKPNQVLLLSKPNQIVLLSKPNQVILLSKPN